MKTVPDGAVQLAITSPPYHIGKAYEKATKLEEYLILPQSDLEFAWFRDSILQVKIKSRSL